MDTIHDGALPGQLLPPPAERDVRALFRIAQENARLAELALRERDAGYGPW